MSLGSWAVVAALLPHVCFAQASGSLGGGGEEAACLPQGSKNLTRVQTPNLTGQWRATCYLAQWTNDTHLRMGSSGCLMLQGQGLVSTRAQGEAKC